MNSLPMGSPKRFRTIPESRFRGDAEEDRLNRDRGELPDTAIDSTTGDTSGFDLIDAKLTTFGAPPVDGLGTTGDSTSSWKRAAARTSKQLDDVAEEIVKEGKRPKVFKGSSPPLARTLPGSGWTSIATSACSWECRSAISSTRSRCIRLLLRQQLQ